MKTLLYRSLRYLAIASLACLLSPNLFIDAFKRRKRMLSATAAVRVVILTLSFVRTDLRSLSVENSISFLTTMLSNPFNGNDDTGIIPMNATEIELKLWRLIGVVPSHAQLPFFFGYAIFSLNRVGCGAKNMSCGCYKLKPISKQSSMNFSDLLSFFQRQVRSYRRVLRSPLLESSGFWRQGLSLYYPDCGRRLDSRVLGGLAF